MDYLVIPAYEPDYNLIKLIQKIQSKSDFHIIVIDDGSSAKRQTVFDKAEQYASPTSSLWVNTEPSSQQMRMASTRFGIFSEWQPKLLNNPIS